MAEALEKPARPETVVIDVPTPDLLPTAGVLLAVFGLLTRCFARWLAWPADWSYHGDRANTVWAYRESLYADLGMVSLVFGLALVWLSIVCRQASRHTAPPVK